MTTEQALQKTLGFGAKTFIEKAIEGGWRSDQRAQLIIVNLPLEPDKRVQAQIGDHILLDPASWQAVGKAEGWTEETEYEVDCHPLDRSYQVYEPTTEKTWLYNWHRFIDTLTEEV